MFINSSPVNKLDSPHRRGFNVRNGKDLPIVWELLVSGVYVLSTRRTRRRHRSSLYHNVDHVCQWALTAESWSWSAPFMGLLRLSVPAFFWLCLLVNLVINGTLQPLSWFSVGNGGTKAHQGMMNTLMLFHQAYLMQLAVISKRVNKYLDEIIMLSKNTEVHIM